MADVATPDTLQTFNGFVKKWLFAYVEPAGDDRSKLDNDTGEYDADHRH